MSKISVFILDIEKYCINQVLLWLEKWIDHSKILSKQKIFSQFIRYFVLSKRFSIANFFFATKNGKPYLYNSDIYFNISHTINNVVIAVANESIGIDIEKVSKKRKCLKIAKKYFRISEFLFLAKSNNLYKDFYTLWTLKESQVKNNSLGISKGLNTAIFKVINNNWVSQKHPNDFITLYHNDLIISVCYNNIKNKTYSFFEIVNFNFKEIKNHKE